MLFRSFVSVREEILSQTSTFVSTQGFDAKDNSIIASAQIDSSGAITTFTVQGGGIVQTITGFFLIRGEFISGHVSGVRYNLLQDGSVLSQISGIGTLSPILFTADGLPTVLADNSYLGIDDFVTGTAGNDYLLGGSGADQIAGLTGNDTVDGGTGVDTMAGGTGDDMYFVDTISAFSGPELVTELPGEGTDTVISSVDFVLGLNVENLNLTGSAANGTGNAGANSDRKSTRLNSSHT